MPEDKDGSSGFRVVDRRGFFADGTRREESAPDSKASQVPRAAEPPAPESAAYEEPVELGPPSFDTIVSYLSTTAFFQLGLLPGPGGERIPPDLVNARRTIDMLEVLQHKTRGNLTTEESHLLEEALYELRMGYLEIQKHLTRPPR